MMPWNELVLRSGRTRFASPPAGSGAWTCAAGAGAGAWACASAGSPSGSMQRREEYENSELCDHCRPLRRVKTPDYTRKSPTRSCPRRARIRSASAIPPVRKMRIPCSTVMSGYDARSRGQMTMSPEIEMVRRHVHRDQRFGALPPIDRELARQEPEHEPLRRVLDQHHPLEAVLVVGGKRDDELLHRRVDAAEERHVQQQPFGALQQPLPHHVGRDRAHQHHGERRGQRAPGPGSCDGSARGGTCCRRGRRSRRRGRTATPARRPR